jgi:hypothetical protein
VQKALWFAKSFGIQFTQIKGADKNGKITFSYYLKNLPVLQGFVSLCTYSGYEALTVFYIFPSRFQLLLKPVLRWSKRHYVCSDGKLTDAPSMPVELLKIDFTTNRF